MSAREEYYRGAHSADMERRLASVVRLGVVSALDEANARVRVTAGDVTTGWMPWTVGRAGPDRHWVAPEIGEQVIMVAPSGDLAQAVVVGSIYTDQHPAPGTTKDVTATEWQDGARLEYNRATHTHDLTVPAGGHIRFTIGGTTWTLTENGAELVTQKLTVHGNIDVVGNINVEGSIDVTQDVTAQTVSLVNHLHTGVVPGPALTGPPEK